MEIFEDRPAGIVIVGLRRGENIFESLEKVARQANVHLSEISIRKCPELRLTRRPDEIGIHHLARA